jgi:hypothetical protein
MKDKRIVQIVTKEVQGPDRPQDFFPDSIYDVLPRVRQLLDKMGDRTHEKAKQKQQEIAEGKTDTKREEEGNFTL